jgi:uncharacterized protein YegL
LAFGDDEPLDHPASSPSEEPEPEAATCGILELTLRLEQPLLHPGQMVFALATIRAKTASATAAHHPRPPLDLVLVLDVSGSMDGGKIQELKRAVLFVLEQSQANDRVAVVAFNHEARRQLRLVRVRNDARCEAMEAVMRLTAGGGTDIAAGIGLGLDVLEQRRQRNQVVAMMLLTDGQDGAARRQLPLLLARAQSLRCSLYVYGVGDDHDSRLLNDIAEQARTPYTFLVDSHATIAAFAGLLGGLSSIVAQQVELHICLSAALKQVHTPFEVQRHETTLRITIPDLFAEERRDVLLEVVAPSQPMLLEAKLRYSDLVAGGAVSTSPLPLIAEITEDSQPEMEPDAEVADQRDRYQVAQTLQSVIQMNDAGDVEGAEQLLHMHEARLARRGTALSRALTGDLVDARMRMQDLQRWRTTGRAAVSDACQTHFVQRCTTGGTSAREEYCRDAQRDLMARAGP